MEDRRNLHVRLSEEAMEGFERVCEENGVSLTAWFEAAGLYFADGGIPIEGFVERAKTIDRERRRRRD